MNKYMCVICVCISLLVINIARVSSLALNPKGTGALLTGSDTYHETPLHNLNDVADLGVESSGTKKDRLHELEEILEDESQSPDEQSVSKYEENVKVFDNPAVLEVTSHPTEDEVKDFQKVRKHELATQDNHFDALNTLLSEEKLFKLVEKMLKKENKTEEKAQEHESGANHTPDKTKLNSATLEANFEGLNPPTNPAEENSTRSDLNSKLNSGLNSPGTPALGNQLALEPHNPLNAAFHGDLLGKLPPLNVNANTRNHFHIFNVHHHYPQPHDSSQYPDNVRFAQGFLTKECFESTLDGKPEAQNCYCSKNETCRCTKTYMMLVSVCDTLVNDPYLKEFCSHHDVKGDHPHLNHRFARSNDNSVADAFKSVHSGMCNYKSFGYCK